MLIILILCGLLFAVSIKMLSLMNDVERYKMFWQYAEKDNALLRETIRADLKESNRVYVNDGILDDEILD